MYVWLQIKLKIFAFNQQLSATTLKFRIRFSKSKCDSRFLKLFPKSADQFENLLLVIQDSSNISI